MRVCIIGAGWYGCHAARILQEAGIDVCLLDKEGIFAGASSKNQNRLHLGYHYPRSPETIEECRTGFAQFLAQYGAFAHPFPRNDYVIHDRSKVSADAYAQRFAGGAHTECSRADLGLQTASIADRVFRVQERFIDTAEVQRAMKERFSSLLQIRTSPEIRLEDTYGLVDGERFDYVLNCTNNQYVPIPFPWSPIYETVCSFLYTARSPETEPRGFTVMDGPFFSLFPYNLATGVYTLTHVVHSVVARGPTLTAPPSDAVLDAARQAAEADVRAVAPDLLDQFVYSGRFLSTKAKYDGETDDRSLRWAQVGRYLSFSGGKITGIIAMERILRQTLELPLGTHSVSPMKSDPCTSESGRGSRGSVEGEPESSP
jgi:glycine/D-amino acid oxidase-like deaminating enzyme